MSNPQQPLEERFREVLEDQFSFSESGYGIEQLDTALAALSATAIELCVAELEGLWKELLANSADTHWTSTPTRVVRMSDAGYSIDQRIKELQALREGL